MFTPVLDLEVQTRATILHFTDTTGPDTVASGGTKWNGVAGIFVSDVSAANLVITDPNGDITTEDVTTLLTAGATITGDVVIADITGQWVDGYYDVEYNIWMVATNIIDVTDYSSTIPGTIKIQSNSHLVQTGMKVTIVGTAGIYDGTYDATYIDANNFYISGTFTVTDTGTSTPCYSNTFTPFIYANVEIALEKMYAIFCEMDESNDADEYLKQIELCNGLFNAFKSAITTSNVSSVNNIYARILRILDFNNMDLIYT